MDPIRPAPEIDIRTGLPILGNQGGTGYLSGPAIRPVTVQDIYEISRFVDVPFVGVGGVSSACDVVEIVMAGATCVGMVAASLLKGHSIVDRVAKEPRQLLAKLDVEDINIARWLTHREVLQFSTKYELRSRIDYDLCDCCKLCSKVCFVRAITDTGERVVANRKRFVSCALCASMCSAETV